jgi:uncharacterized RDD family membrane protein YckC
MKLGWVSGVVLWAAAVVLMYLSLHSNHLSPDAKDLMFFGGFMLCMTSTSFSPANWARVSRQDASPLTIAYSGIWFRLVAALMDFLFVGVVMLCVTRTLIDMINLVGWAHVSRRVGDLGVLYVVVLLCGYWVYHAAMESSPLEATMGKIILRLRVTDLEGHRISFARATFRYLGKMLSLATFLVGFLVAIFTKRKQALHDLFAKTLVVDA